MAMQYQGKIERYNLSPVDGSTFKLTLNIHIPKLNTDIELEETGSMYYLEDKYPFIKKYPAYSILSKSAGKICLIEKDNNDSFRFVAYLTLSATL
ncbi:MAG: hypothetical protein K0Q79_2 [Flavipsychrobacter sp.]|jgi:hypothetical protein|nr:hypothetical protein [Flavipsychrobacter sp.]